MAQAGHLNTRRPGFLSLGAALLAAAVLWLAWATVQHAADEANCAHQSTCPVCLLAHGKVLADGLVGALIAALPVVWSLRRQPAAEIFSSPSIFRIRSRGPPA